MARVTTAQWMLTAFITLSVCVYVTRRVTLSPNSLFPVGIDTLGHLTKVDVLAQRWATARFGDWLPEWYMGSTIGQYYPPLSLWVGALMQIITNNVLVTFKILSVGCLVGGGLAVAGLTRRLGGSFSATVVASVSYSTASYTLYTVYSDGTLGRILGLMLYPLLLSVLLDLVEESKVANWLGSASLVMLMVLAHILQAYQMFLTIAVFMLTWCFCTRRPRAVLVLAAVSVLGVLLASFWIVPGVTQLENPGVPWSPPEILSATTLSPWTLVSSSSPFAGVALFIGASLAGVLLAIRKETRPLALSLLVSYLVTVSMLTGAGNPLFNLLPMRETIRPLRFINALLLPASVLYGFLSDILCEQLSLRFRLPSNRVLSSLMAVGLLVLSLTVDKEPNFAAPDPYGDLVRLVDEIPGSDGSPFDKGRVGQELPLRGGESAYLPVRQGFNIATGWNIEGTVHQYTLYDHNLAYSEGDLDYILRNWYLWNVRSALIDEKYNPMIQRLFDDGWRSIDTREEITLLTSPRPSTYLMSPNLDAIVIGRSSAFVSRLLPWVSQGRVPDPLLYDEGYLDLFKCIILYDLPRVDAGALEKRVVEWVRKGKTIILDLSVTDSVGEFLGVRHSDIPLGGRVTVSYSQQGRLLSATDLELILQDGRGATYERLDSVLAWAITADGPRAVLGIRELQNGPVYFIGGHVPRLVQKGFRDGARQFLEPLVSLAEPRKSIVPDQFVANRVGWTHNSIRVSYESPEPEALLVSVTYSPRWHAYLDGEPLTVFRHEDLMLLLVPGGSHQVALRYQGTWVTRLGWVVSASSLILTLLGAVICERRAHRVGR